MAKGACGLALTDARFARWCAEILSATVCVRRDPDHNPAAVTVGCRAREP